MTLPEGRLGTLENEFKLLKGEIKHTLVDLRSMLMNAETPVSQQFITDQSGIGAAVINAEQLRQASPPPNPQPVQPNAPPPVQHVPPPQYPQVPPPQYPQAPPPYAFNPAMDPRAVRDDGDEPEPPSRKRRSNEDRVSRAEDLDGGEPETNESYDEQSSRGSVPRSNREQSSRAESLEFAKPEINESYDEQSGRRSRPVSNRERNSESEAPSFGDPETYERSNEHPSRRTRPHSNGEQTSRPGARNGSELHEPSNGHSNRGMRLEDMPRAPRPPMGAAGRTRISYTRGAAPMKLADRQAVEPVDFDQLEQVMNVNDISSLVRWVSHAKHRLGEDKKRWSRLSEQRCPV